MSKNNIITDWSASAGAALPHHLVALCLLLALSAADLLILELLPGLTPGQLEMLRGNKIITKKTADFKEKFLGENAQEQFQNHLPKAFEIMTEVLNAPPGGEMKLAQRFEAAKWLFEKVTGKARQELELSGGTTILQLLQALDKRNEATALPAAHSVIDVTPTKERDPLADWVSANVPILKSEKG